MQKIYPCLWFDQEAEEAARFYISVFPNSRLLGISHYGPDMHMPEGTVLAVSFELDDREFMALNAGPVFKFNEAVSLVVPCKTQAEIDALWAKLSAVPESEQCGWLKDKYGLSWQIVPAMVLDLLSQGDQEKINRMMQALMPMKKLDFAALKRAYDGPA